MRWNWFALVVLLILLVVSVHAQRVPIRWQQPVLGSGNYIEFSKDGKHALIQEVGSWISDVHLLSSPRYERKWSQTIRNASGEMHFGPTPNTIWVNVKEGIDEYSALSGALIRRVKDFPREENPGLFAVAENGKVFVTQIFGEQFTYLRIYDTLTGDLIRKIPCVDRFYPIQISPDSKKILHRTCWYDSSGRLIGLSSPGLGILKFSPDSKRVYEVHRDRNPGVRLRTYNAETGAILSNSVITGVSDLGYPSDDANSVLRIAVSATGKTLFFFGILNKQLGLVAVNTANGSVRNFLPATDINGLAARRSGSGYAALATFNGFTHRAFFTGDFDEANNRTRRLVAHSIDGGYAEISAVLTQVSGRADAPALIVNRGSATPNGPPAFVTLNGSGKVLTKFSPASNTFLRFSPDGSRYIHVLYEVATIVDVKTGEQIQKFDRRIQSACWLDNRTVLTAGDGEVRVDKESAGKWSRQRSFRMDYRLIRLAVSPSRKFLAIQTGAGVSVYDFDKWQLLLELSARSTQVDAMAFNEADELLLVVRRGFEDVDYVAYNVKTQGAPPEKRSYGFMQSLPNPSEFSPDGSLLALGFPYGLAIVRTADGTVASWDPYFGPFEPVSHVGFSADNSTLYVGTVPGSLYALALPRAVRQSPQPFRRGRG